ncbi:GNAT family N-acetyltransferase [Flocculibacter collagenilyticus]|uniref:GNAT family N-acetyltransferase n=1 Tax=Flocculibacter collagenilyticus TaxID=2744479 RepID=UPI0018F59AF2|nr:GNAT family N-acetyltransferase [Flocculibacter collagenilyticus]
MIKLRNLENTDQELLVQYLNNARVTRYLSSRIPQPYTQEDARWFVNVGSKENSIVKAIIVDDVFCGVIGAYTQQLEYAHSAELGFWLAEKYWGRGIATKAIIHFTDFIFSSTKITRLYNPVSAPNKASLRAMEKASYSLEGVLKQSVCKHKERFDEYLYAKVTG